MKKYVVRIDYLTHDDVGSETEKTDTGTLSVFQGLKEMSRILERKKLADPLRHYLSVSVDGREPYSDSKLKNIEYGVTFREWAKELPFILRCEFGDEDFEIRFSGDDKEYEELKNVIDDAEQKELLSAKLKRIPALF